MGIRELIQKIARDGQTVGCITCTVTAVDKSARTVDVEPLNEDAPILACNLQANQGSTFGVVQFPRVGSYVVVALLSDVDAGVVLMCDDVESVEIVVKDKDTGSVVVSEDGVVMNGGSLGGLVKVEDLTERLNIIEKDINKLKKVFSRSWKPVPQDGGAALKSAATSWAGATLTETQRSDYEKEKVKQ